MTFRERVLAALAFERPDRTPRDFWAEPPTWNRLLAHYGHTDRERALCDLGIDLRHLDAVAPPEREVRPGIFRNMWGEQYRYVETGWGPMRDDVKGALAGAQAADLERFDWPRVDDLDHSLLRAQCDQHADHALIYGSADIWQRPALVRGWEEMFLDMVERPDWVHALCDRFCEFYLEDYTRAAEVTGGRIDLYLLISDLGSQTGPLISPTMFRGFVAPYIRRMAERIHGLGGRVLFHSCGAMRVFIEDLVSLGVDVLDPIQPLSPGMSPESLQADFGGQIAFHGGLDMQRLLPRGTPEEVRAEARRYCEILGANGGYILSPAHLFQPDVPPANIVAMYEGQ
jgi:uroporphyrinogen decarboxylase